MKRASTEQDEPQDIITTLPTEILLLIVQLIMNANQTTDELEHRIYTPIIYINSMRNTCKFFHQIVRKYLSDFSKNDWTFFRLYKWPCYSEMTTLKFKECNLTRWVFNQSLLHGPFVYLDAFEKDVFENRKILETPDNQNEDVSDYIHEGFKIAIDNTDFGLFFWLFQICCLTEGTIISYWKFPEGLLSIALTSGTNLQFTNWFLSNCTDQSIIDSSFCEGQMYDHALDYIRRDNVEFLSRMINTDNFEWKDQFKGEVLVMSQREGDSCDVWMILNFYGELVSPICEFKSLKIMEWLVKSSFFTGDFLSDLEKQDILKRFKKIAKETIPSLIN